MGEWRGIKIEELSFRHSDNSVGFMSNKFRLDDIIHDNGREYTAEDVFHYQCRIDSSRHLLRSFILCLHW